MKLTGLPCGAIDWAEIAATTHPGETGAATMRAQVLGDLQLRIVEYGAGYLADHWCDKGHVIHVIAGPLTIEYRDGSRHELAAGMSWHVADNGAPSHRVVCERGARVFIVD
jgi:hypothetical protein